MGLRIFMEITMASFVYRKLSEELAVCSPCPEGKMGMVSFLCFLSRKKQDSASFARAI